MRALQGFSAQKPSSFSLPPAQARSALGEHSGYTKRLKQNPGVLVSITSCGNSPGKAAGFLLHTEGKKAYGEALTGTSGKAVAGSVEPGPHLGPSTRPGGSSGKEVNARRARAARSARTLAGREPPTFGAESGGRRRYRSATVQSAARLGERLLEPGAAGWGCVRGMRPRSANGADAQRRQFHRLLAAWPALGAVPKCFHMASPPVLSSSRVREQHALPLGGRDLPHPAQHIAQGELHSAF